MSHRLIPLIIAGVMSATGAFGQSANPEPGASFGDDYAPRPAFPQQTKAPAPAIPSDIAVTIVAKGLRQPWSLAFLPGGNMLVTERQGILRLVSRQGKLSPPIAGVPAVKDVGTKGLHDIALDPGFARNRLVYLSYFAPNPARPLHESEAAFHDWVALLPVERERNPVGFDSVGRGKLSADGKRLENFQVILARPDMGVRRLVFARDGTLLITADTPGTGDLPTGDEPQSLHNLYGKVLRINSDGSVPWDNPFRSRKDAQPEIYAYGFRDPEGAVLDPATGALWMVENGPRGGDELNLVRAGRNYGFPAISYGLDFQGRMLGTRKLRHAGMAQPVYFWTPSLAPSGLAFYDGKLSSRWRGDIFLGAMAGKHLVRLHMVGGKVKEEEPLLMNVHQRIRDVREGPDGALYVLTAEKDGRLLRVTPRQ
jgi:glucose/arabinose dehydrogenase